MVRISPGAMTTDTVDGANPSFATTMSTDPGGTVTVTTPCGFVRCATPLTTMDASGTAFPPARTSTRRVASCAQTVTPSASRSGTNNTDLAYTPTPPLHFPSGLE